MRAFLTDERGAATLDFVMVFVPVLLFVLTIAELVIAFHFTSAAQKSANLAVRLAAGREPVHTEVWETNRLDPRFGNAGDACYQPTGDACMNPGRAWVCTGNALEPGCDPAAFDALIAEVRRLYPTVRPDDVTVAYVYRRLGVAGGPFVPEISVSISRRPAPVNFLSLVGLLELRATTASIMGEDMSS